MFGGTSDEFALADAMRTNDVISTHVYHRGAKSEAAWNIAASPIAPATAHFLDYTSDADTCEQTITRALDATHNFTDYVIPCDGIFNVKARLNWAISLPAVLALGITSARLYYGVYQGQGRTLIDTGDELHGVAATYTPIGGLPIPSYIREANIAGADKFRAVAGNIVRFYMDFNGAGAIDYFDTFDFRFALLRESPIVLPYDDEQTTLTET